MSLVSSHLRRGAAVLVGIVLLCSGMLKLVDPVGTMLIVTEYCKFFHLGFLIPAAKGLGVAISFVEATLGIALITGVFRKITAICSYVVLGFFTLVTLALLIANPDMDCGCFGQAIHLTHAQSVFKNIVLLVLCALAFTPFKTLGEPRKPRLVSAAISLLSILFLTLYSSHNLPLTDFTAFHLGSELYASLEDEIAGDNHYTPVFIYERNGQRGSFPLNALPDSSWTFVGQDTLFQKTSVPWVEQYPVLSFADAEGNYQDQLAAEGIVVVFSVYDLSKVSWPRLQQQSEAVLNAGGKPLVLLASYPAQAHEMGLPDSLPAYYADYKTLITLNRANGGGTYFCEGELINKWTPDDFPAHLEEDFLTDPVVLSSRHIVRRRLFSQGFIVYLAAILILL